MAFKHRRRASLKRGTVAQVGHIRCRMDWEQPRSTLSLAMHGVYVPNERAVARVGDTAAPLCKSDAQTSAEDASNG